MGSIPLHLHIPKTAGLTLVRLIYRFHAQPRFGRSPNGLLKHGIYYYPRGIEEDAYLKSIPFQDLVAPANILPTDDTGNRELLEMHGWELIEPWRVAASPDDYQAYIAKCRAEICCPKPVFRELKTGWFSAVD